MGRTSRRKKVNKIQDEEESSIEDEPNPESEEFFHDDVSKFTMNREKIPLDPEAELSEDELNEDEIEEVMGLDLDDSDDDDDDDDDEDDEDDSESNDETKLPNDKAWGKKKSIYYNADTGDADIGSDEEAWELEQQEEEEALALQKRMGAALDEEGLDLADFEIPFEGVPEELSVGDDKEEKTIAVDLSKLSKAQKLEILFRDSPELFELLEEFKEKLDEVETQLSPLLDLAKVGRLPVEGAKYVELKKELYLNYCINIGFYLLLKARQSSVKDHPVIERIVQYRTLIKELQPIDKKLESDIEILLANKETLLQPEDAQSLTKPKIPKDTKLKKQGKKVKAKAKLSALLDENEDDEDQEHQPPKKKTKRLGEKEEATIDPLQYYEQVRLEKKKAKEMKKIAARLAHEPEFDQNYVEMDEEGKRAITYQISKNKGLTVRRKKQDRNPRVKHRKKYSKAIIKRKSQVRPVTNEDTRYGGEKSGIRAFLTRSVKIK